MKKAILIFLLSVLIVHLPAQDIQHEVVTVNIEVPVRVFKGETFIDNLTLTDFELYEDGILQNIEAVYLIKKRSVEKREESRRFSPSVSRFYALIFILTDFLPRVNEAIDYFFQEVFLPGDSLSVATPLKSYNLKADAIARLSKEDLKNQLITIIRRDVQMGNLEYKRVIRELRGFAQEEDDLNYLTTLSRLEQLRYIDQDSLENFANYLKLLEGQKNVFLFYQQELIPQMTAAVGPVDNPTDDLNWLLPGLRASSVIS